MVADERERPRERCSDPERRRSGEAERMYPRPSQNRNDAEDRRCPRSRRRGVRRGAGREHGLNDGGTVALAESNPDLLDPDHRCASES